MKLIIIILFIWCEHALAQTAQEPFKNDSLISKDSTITEDSVKFFKLSVISNLNDAKIYSDTAFIGMTPLRNYSIKEGSHNLKIVNPKTVQDWQNDNESFSIVISNDTTLNVNFRYFYFINTIPFSAKVFRSDSLLGETPLRFFSDNEVKGKLLIKKKNYKDYLYDLKDYNFETGANITLNPKGLETVNDVVYKDRSTQFNTKRNLPAILATGGAALAGCFFAMNFKQDANNEYDRYLITGNETQLQNSQNNDTYFVISVVLMQAAIGGLIYFLFFDK
ncbi:MAG: PEGA domain-containing protein [Ignavibacteria bacterium]|nr:PEGA domain-containing protein [Ignavibacteria bacterium]